MLKTKYNIVKLTAVEDCKNCTSLYRQDRERERDETTPGTKAMKCYLSLTLFHHYRRHGYLKFNWVFHMHWQKKLFRLITNWCQLNVINYCQETGNRIIQTQISHQLKQTQQLLEDDDDLWLQLARLIPRGVWHGQTEQNISSTWVQ